MLTSKLLSKTKLLRGYQCLKNIYLTVHQPHLEAAITPDKQAIFAQGNAVGDFARRQFIPGGVMVQTDPWDFTGALQKTRELLQNGEKIIYEAAFEHQGCFARADIIVFNNETKKWKVYEVKSSTKVKPEHLDDTALQAWILAGAGIPLEQIFLVHLNPECTYPHLNNLFCAVDVTAELRLKYPKVAPKLKEIYHCLQNPTPPDVDIGAHCTDPYDCGFKDFCFKQKNIPELSVFDLPGIRQRRWDLYKEGILDLKDERIKDLTPVQERAIQCHRTGKRFFNENGISSAMANWKFPLTFLDFETINPAIPSYDGCRPFDHIPFQFSVHKLKELNGSLDHIEFLHTGAGDPRKNLIEKLIGACDGPGSIVSYYARFEGDRIRELAEHFPQYKEKLLSLIERLVDPLPIIQENIYDVAFRGSFSLKSVAPAILGDKHSYEGMLVGDGLAAQRAFNELLTLDSSSAKAVELREAMIEYCKKDTLVMVELVKWLYGGTYA